MRLLYTLLLSLLLLPLTYSQTTGSIIGKVLDKDMNDEPLPFANILIEGTSIGTTTDFDGLFELNDLSPGDYQVLVSFVGYETQRVAVTVAAEKITEFNISIGTLSDALDEVIVTTVARKDSEMALLINQKNALVMKQEIGAEEISKKGISDAATAVVKTSGVSRQEGSGTIFVRGLGDRYNITLYNGLPLPSNSPSRKNIDLGLFTTDIVKSISIDKAFQAIHYGDFAGASINIIPKETAGNTLLNFSLGGGVNSTVAKLDQFYLHSGPSRSGFYEATYPKDPLNAYRFKSGMDRQEAFGGATPLNSNFGVQLNKTFSLGEYQKLTVFAVGNFDSKFTYNEGVSRGSVNTSGLVFKDFDFKKYQYETHTTGMLNLGYLAEKYSLKYNSLLVNSTNQNQQEYKGIIDVFDYAPEGGGYVQRAVFERTTLWVNQLLGDFAFSKTLSASFGLGYNLMDNSIPNRRQTTITPDNWDNPEGPLSFRQTLNAGDNHRFYQGLNEAEWAANVSIDYLLGLNDESDFSSKISLGYNGKQKTFDFGATQFNFKIITRSNGQFINQPLVSSPYALDQYFNQTNFLNGLFDIRTFRGRSTQANALDPQTYDGAQNIHAGFVNFEHKLSDKTSMLLGLRAENIYQEIGWSTSIDPAGDRFAIDKLEWLPSLILRHALKEDQNLRLSLSKTYTLPQIKERALFQFEEVTQVYIGNPALYASTDYNFDLKWEYFPTGNELLSAAVFGKLIQNPINDAAINSASNDISYVNSGDQAVAAGTEIEIRKNLLSKVRSVGDEELKQNLSLGVNFSYLYSHQKLDAQKVLSETQATGLLPLSVDFTKTSDKLTGASEILANIDTTYLHEFNAVQHIQASLLFNYFSDRIYAFGTEGRGNIVDQGIPTLNLVAKGTIAKGFGLSLSAKNLLNPDVARFQEAQNVTILSYKKGIELGVGINYAF